ncbi:MAG: hypothetical protein WAT19_11265 [Ferruginibacter sp.]
MKNLIITLALIHLANLVHAQAGYQYNGATGKYEYNTDPLGGMAQRYQDFTKMQMATMQRINDNLLANSQLAQQSVGGMSAGDLALQIKAVSAAGKMKIDNGRASNQFNWVFPDGTNDAQKQQALTVKKLIASHGLNTNNYADVKAFFFVTYYLVATGGTDESRLQKKGEAKRLAPQYLANEYIQGMNDAQKTSNILEEINYLGRIAAAGSSSAGAKQIATQALFSKGFASIPELQLTNGGLIKKQLAARANAKTTFKRIPKNIFIAEMLQSNKLPSEQEARFLHYMTQFDEIVKKIGGPNNDHAFGQSVMFALYYTIYTDGKTLSQKQLDAVIKLFYNDLVADDKFQSSDDQTLQKLYERIATETMAISDLYAIARSDKTTFEKKLNDPKTDAAEKYAMASDTKVYDRINSVKEMAHGKLKEFFMPRNFDAYELKEEGFVKK